MSANLESQPERLTLEQIKAKYPPEWEYFEHKEFGHPQVNFFTQVCRRGDGTPLWFSRAYIIPQPSPLPNPDQKPDPVGQ